MMNKDTGANVARPIFGAGALVIQGLKSALAVSEAARLSAERNAVANEQKLVTAQQELGLIGRLIDYPDQWDTVNYPTLYEAVYETIEAARDGPPSETKQPDPVAVDPGDLSNKDIQWFSAATPPAHAGNYAVRLWEMPQRDSPTYTEINMFYDGVHWLNKSGHVATDSDIPGWHEKDEWGYVPYDPTQEVT